MRDRKKAFIAIPSACLTAAFLSLSIAIRALDYPGRGSHIRVAILSTPAFDPVRQIDPTSITFGRTGVERSLESCGADDVNADRVPDLVCQFDTKIAGFTRGVPEGGILRAADINRIRLEGRVILIVPCDPLVPCGATP